MLTYKRCQSGGSGGVMTTKYGTNSGMNAAIVMTPQNMCVCVLWQLLCRSAVGRQGSDGRITYPSLPLPTRVPAIPIL